MIHLAHIITSPCLTRNLSIVGLHAVRFSTFVCRDCFLRENSTQEGYMKPIVLQQIFKITLNLFKWDIAVEDTSMYPLKLRNNLCGPSGLGSTEQAARTKNQKEMYQDKVSMGLWKTCCKPLAHTHIPVFSFVVPWNQLAVLPVASH